MALYSYGLYSYGRSRQGLVCEKHRPKPTRLPTLEPTLTPTERECSPGCSDRWVNDGSCDAVCKTSECGCDGGDCGLELVGGVCVGGTAAPTRKCYWCPEGLLGDGSPCPIYPWPIYDISSWPMWAMTA